MEVETVELVQVDLLLRQTQVAVAVVDLEQLAEQAVQASSSSNTLVVPQQVLQSLQDRPHGLPRLA